MERGRVWSPLGGGWARRGKEWRSKKLAENIHENKKERNYKMGVIGKKGCNLTTHFAILKVQQVNIIAERKTFYKARIA